jgi:hypothetical protein
MTLYAGKTTSYADIICPICHEDIIIRPSDNGNNMGYCKKCRKELEL